MARDDVEAMVERAMDSAAVARAASAAVVRAVAQAQAQAPAPATAMAVEDSASGESCGGRWGRAGGGLWSVVSCCRRLVVALWLVLLCVVLCRGNALPYCRDVVRIRTGRTVPF